MVIVNRNIMKMYKARASKIIITTTQLCYKHA